MSSTCLLLQFNFKEGERRSWSAGAVFLAIPPRLALPPLMSWEPSLPAKVAQAAKATPTWMGETTKARAQRLFMEGLFSTHDDGTVTSCA